ncbi:MAG: hypothetical protein ACRDIB_14475, partial [Ardenticatenaceae bacterium]
MGVVSDDPAELAAGFVGGASCLPPWRGAASASGRKRLASPLNGIVERRVWAAGAKVAGCGAPAGGSVVVGDGLV